MCVVDTHTCYNIVTLEYAYLNTALTLKLN